MDNNINQVPMNEYTFDARVTGLGVAVALNEPVLSKQELDGEQDLTESEKEEIIMECKDAASKKEIDKILDAKVPDGNVSSLFEGPKTR